MIKTFCDCCGEEIKHNFVDERLKIVKTICGKKIEVEVIVAMNGVWNEGAICEDCLTKLFK